LYQLHKPVRIPCVVGTHNAPQTSAKHRISATIESP